MVFASVKEGIGRFLGLEDQLQAIFVLFRAVYWIFRLELCSSATGQRLESTNSVQGRLNVGTMLLLIGDRSPRCCFNRWNSLGDPYPRPRSGASLELDFLFGLRNSNSSPAVAPPLISYSAKESSQIFAESLPAAEPNM